MVPSRITCNEIIPETYPWYIRTPEKRQQIKNKKYEGQKITENENKEKEKKRKANINDKKKKDVLSGRRPSPQRIR